MSARPRPITATVTKPSSMAPPTLSIRRSISPESMGDSTASLVSVLDHDSFSSAPSSSDSESEESRTKQTDRYAVRGVLTLMLLVAKA